MCTGVNMHIYIMHICILYVALFMHFSHFCLSECEKMYSHVMSLVCSCCQKKGKDQWIFPARVKHDRHNESLS